VRRVHAVACFYNPKIEREPGEDEQEGLVAGRCPLCDGLLGEPERGWVFLDDLRREGRVDLEEVKLHPSVRIADHERRFREKVKGPP